ncbi:MAG: HEAT repeat domain-containing protein [Verrucomicrobiota bacterium]|nr:HEAT repeat domain-containing protein [Verrucomicrobiota bacterium]
MPTEIERRVLEVLSAIEIEPDLARQIEDWGNEAVTVVCEAALGTYVGLRPKIRTNAIALLGDMSHPQARETLPMLVNDDDTDVAIYAMRAAGRQRNDEVVENLGRVLRESDVAPLVAAEALKALTAIDSSATRSHLEAYSTASAERLPHRASAVVTAVLHRPAPAR